jgi:hypothetical protein
MRSADVGSVFAVWRLGCRLHAAAVRLLLPGALERRLLGVAVVVVLGIGSVFVAAPSPANAAAPLKISVTDGREVAARGEVLRYSVTISNPAGGSARQLSVRQSLGEELEFVSASDGGAWDAVRRIVSWPRLSLGPGLTAQLTVVARVRTNAAVAEASSTAVRVSGAGLAMEAIDQTWISPGLELINTDGRETARPGDSLTYTITIAKPEATAPVPLSVVCTLDADLELVSAPDGNFDPSSRRVSWEDIDLPVAELVTLTFTARLSTDAPSGVLATTAVVIAQGESFEAIDETIVRNVGDSSLDAAVVDAVPAGTVTLLNQNQGGSWCWFEDERVLIDRAGRRLYASVNTGVDMYGAARLLELELGSGSRRIVDEGRAEVDDHNTAAIWEAPNGEILTSWSRHGKDTLHRQHRRLTDGSWVAQTPAAGPWYVTYNNLYSVNNGALLYNFYRSAGNDPYVETSTDSGRTWTQRGRLLRDPENRLDRWPYLKYMSNGADRIDFMATPSHPRQTATEIYHGFIRGGVVHRSDGTALGPVGSSIDVERLTLVWRPPNETTDGWDVDLAVDPTSGRPVLMFTRTINFDDNRFYYARWDGSRWDVDHVAYAGRSLYDPERQYTGLAAIDPTNVNNVVISTDANPVTGQPLTSTVDGRRHRELYRGVRRSDGQFTWTTMTTNSSVENLRPVWTASESGASALLWLRGRYTTFINFSMALVGIVRQAGGALVTPGTFRSPQDNGPAEIVPGNFDRAATDDFLMYRASGGPEELRLFDTRRNISRIPLQAGYDDRQPVAGDFTGDGQTDIYWYAPGSTADRFWRQYSSAFTASTPQQVQGTYRPVVGDFDGDRDDDIFWYAAGSGPETLWLSTNGRFRSVTTSQVGGTYTPLVGDFNGSGTDDIFWYAPGAGPDSVWFSSNGSFTLKVPQPVNGNYLPTVGNFDGTRGDDIFWYYRSGPDPLWLSTNSRYFTNTQARDMGPPPPGGHQAVSGNFDGAGGDDIIWYAPTAADTIWESRQSPFDVVRQIAV